MDPQRPALTICADVGGSFVDIAVVADESSISHRNRHATPVDDWAAFRAIFVGLVDIYAAVPRDTPLSIALAGFVDPETRCVTSANLHCLNGRSLAHELQAATGRKVVVTNDADCFTLAETVLGAARNHRAVFGVILGTGVGGGLVMDGKLICGQGGVSGEWGHGPIITGSRRDPGATPYFLCGCGQSGCLDTIGGARGLERLQAYLHGTPATSQEITRRWIDGDSAAAETMSFYFELVSGPLAALVNATGVSVVPVGGGLASCRPLILELDAHVRHRLLRRTAAPLVIATELGGNAGILGAALAMYATEVRDGTYQNVK